ncbi:hypothetical protein SAMN05216389_1217 [Oceanobacillus limi]|uniref:Phage minor capsid protein 2 n=1 Tax=Oceanobacillus limi TaxID=930131 RepID=A0A1I0GE98_9BACI|nr:hypothetical protein [Oceanobacillus limi]SET69131.1 hypothetical protein SAMN05216389_1217 [Oceanobacillus limi]
MTAQERINTQLATAFERYQTENERLQRFAISEIDRSRLELIDLLNEYAKKDNTISRARVNSLLRDLDEVERIIRNNGITALNKVIEDSAESAVTASATALGAIVAVDAISPRRINRNVLRYVTNRYSDDGLVLSDRIWRLAGEQRDELNKTLRSGILQGRSVNQMTVDIRKVYDNETWKIRRLVTTEGNTAHRVATAYSASDSDVVKAVQIIDHPGHRRHEHHECYRLSRQNPYGWGAGMYRPEDTYIYAPHPQCRASFRYILKDEYLGGDN